MATIVTREFGATAKGSPLTNEELDNNFINLNAELGSLADEKEHYKAPVKVATTANITLSGTQTIDGIAVVAGDRVLVKNQTTASQNGIYVVETGAWTRALDANTTLLVAHCIVPVDLGTVHGNDVFTSSLRSTDTLGTTVFTFSKIVRIPIKFDVAQTGALPTAEQGVLEVDSAGSLYYTDNTTVGRGALMTNRGIFLANNGTNITAGPSNFFQTANQTGIQLEGSQIYEIVCLAYFTKTVQAGTATFQWVLSSVPSFIRSRYDATAAAGFTTAAVATAAVTTAQVVAGPTATVSHAASGSLTAGANHIFEFRVILRTSAAANIRLQVTPSLDGIQPLAGSFMTARKIHGTLGVLV